MGPIIRVPNDLAQRLAEETDLVEVDPVLPNAVDEVDVELGDPPGVIVRFHRTPRSAINESRVWRSTNIALS